MKTKPSKSVTMKLDVKTTPYFAAYSLKALNPAFQTTRTNNNGSKDGQRTKMSRRLKIFPMVNPYSEKRISINMIKLPDNIQPGDDHWFNNYE